MNEKVKLNILLENLRPFCRFYDNDRFCNYRNDDFTDSGKFYTNCEGMVSQCELKEAQLKE